LNNFIFEGGETPIYCLKWYDQCCGIL